MPNFLITELEVEFLAGLPHAAIVLYLALRRVMDYATGLVGMARGVSWQSLREELHVDPHQGMQKSGSPSLGQMRRICGHLERAGLVERRSIEREHLIFFLPKATTDQCVQNKPGTKPTQTRHRKTGTSQSPASTQKEMLFSIDGSKSRHDSRKTETQKADTPPVSGISNPLTSFGGDAAPSAGDAPNPGQDTEEIRVACAAIWRAYSEAYHGRYGVFPIRNARTNAQVRQLALRIGRAEAPGLAAWFVSHNGGWYVRHGHQIGSLLSDAEKLRTEWVTGKRMTSTRARQMDQTAANVDAVSEAMAILEKTRRSHA